MDLILRDADSAESAREQIEAVKEEALRAQRAAQAQLIRRRRAIETQQEALKAELERVKEETERALGPVREFMRQLEDGLYMVDLYLGTQEQIKTLRDGPPASIDEPIVLRQLVLAMDEECAVAAEDGGMDALSIEEFDDWVLADPAHLEQVLPEVKGCVALVPRWQAGKDYDDPWKMAEVEKQNRQTYFLIRNGEQLYRIWTNFRVGRRLMPGREQYSDYFWAGKEGREAIRPGTEEWGAAEKRAEAEEKHYRRVAVIFEGLIHRTTVWHPLHPAGVSFLDEDAHDAGRVRFVMDADDDRLIGTGREPFSAWRDRLTGNLRPGMRVIVAPNGVHQEGWYLKGEHRSQSGRHNPRLHPPGISDLPPEGALLTIEERDSEGFLICRFKRTEEVYDPSRWVESKTRPGWGHHGGYHVPKTRATLKIKPGDWWVLPYDLASIDEMEVYMRARLDRHGYIRMFPVLKSAIAAKHAEAVEEAPFRVMLEGVLARENGGTVEEARDRIPDLVEWYKLANRHHRALSGDQADAVRQILAEDSRRLRERAAQGHVIQELRYVYEDAMLIARQRGSGKYVVLEPMEDGDNVYARRVLYGVRSGPTEDVEWWKPEPFIVGRWQVLWSNSRWAAWNVGAQAKDWLTGPERDRLLAEILAWCRSHKCGTCKGSGKTTRWKESKRVPVTCETCSGSGTAESEVLSIRRDRRDDGEVVRGWGSFMVWRVSREAGSAPADGRKVSWAREKDGTAKVALYGEDGWRYSTSYGRDWHERDKDLDPEEERQLRGVRKGALWIDLPAVEALEKRLARQKRDAERKRDRDQEVYPYSRAIEDLRAARGRVAHVAAFVERYEHPELYEGHMKAHPAERYEHEPLLGLRKAIRKALDAGTVPEGSRLGDIWPDAPEEDRGLCFPDARDPDVEEVDPEVEGPDYDIDGEIEVLELAAGEETET